MLGSSCVLLLESLEYSILDSLSASLSDDEEVEKDDWAREEGNNTEVVVVVVVVSIASTPLPSGCAYSLQAISPCTCMTAFPPTSDSDGWNLWKSLVSLDRRMAPSTRRYILFRRNQQFGITLNFASKSTSPQSSRSSYSR